MPELHDENGADDDGDGDGDEGDEGGDGDGDGGGDVVVVVAVVVSASEPFFRQRAGCWQRPPRFFAAASSAASMELLQESARLAQNLRLVSSGW